MYHAQSLLSRLDSLEGRVCRESTIDKIGKVVQVTGLVIESEGPEVALGDLVVIQSTRAQELEVVAEVVGFRDNRVLLMPMQEVQDLHPGCQVLASDSYGRVPVGDALLGRVIDGFGQPMDGGGTVTAQSVRGLSQSPPNPMLRQNIEESFSTGVRAIDNFTPLGCGQRMGIFAGSGVGKSTLLGMIARGSEADINVIALVGERGRELREFIENDLGEEGLARSVVVVSTSDQPAPLRMRAALMATRIAEEFRDEGKKVLFLMDSVTRFAMAQREIGLAIGEPPASRGYTPSVFSRLPQLMERTGMGERGSITALYTVLVDGDDMNEPVADAVRGILDGHIVLSRDLATANHFPAIDVLESVSRLTRALCDEEELATVGQARDWLALYRKNEDLINIGAYVKGSNVHIDQAVERHEPLMKFLKQSFNQLVNRQESQALLKTLVS